MNDEFLYNARPVIRGGFADDLFQKISKQSEPWIQRKFFPAQNHLKAWATVLGLVIFVVACARQLLSPNFHFEGEVGNYYIYEMDYRIQHRRDWENIYHTLPNEYFPFQWYPTNQIAQISSLFESGPPYPYDVPTELPEGYNLTAGALFTEKYSHPYQLYIQWDNLETQAIIRLFVRDVNYEYSQLDIGPGSWETIQINRVDAILVQGQFGAPYTYDELVEFFASDELYIRSYWDSDLGVRLYWEIEGVFYALESTTNSYVVYRADDFPTTFATEEELILMAESMIPEQ